MAVVGMSTDARKAALADVYNPFAVAAIMHHIQDIDPRLVLDMDGVHVILGDKIGDRVCVRLTKHSKDWLRNRGLSTASGARKR